MCMDEAHKTYLCDWVMNRCTFPPGHSAKSIQDILYTDLKTIVSKNIVAFLPGHL